MSEEKGKKPVFDFDFFFKPLAGIFKKAKAGGDMKRLRSIPPDTSLDKIKKMEGVYGFHARLGLGKPEIEWFGEQKNFSSAVKEEKEKIREPRLDIFEEKDRITVIAELPGVNEKDIKVKVEGRELTIGAVSAARKYEKALKLPCEVKEELKQTYRNGILELVLKKGKQN